MAGYERVTDAAKALRDAGVKMSDRTLYAIERAEHVLTVSEYLGILVVYAPPSGGQFFLPCFRQDVQEMFQRTAGFYGVS